MTSSGTGAIFEVGCTGGGSTTLVSLLAEPRKLVSCELNAEPVAGLASFIEAQGTGRWSSPFYGVDQSDHARLTEIVEAEFGGELLDLVLDDASHQYLPTDRASFEVLFPGCAQAGCSSSRTGPPTTPNTKRVVATMQDGVHAELRRTRGATHGQAMIE